MAATISLKEIDPAPFNALVGEEIFGLIVDRAPTKVRTRVAKSLEHYTKAARLVGVDDEAMDALEHIVLGDA